MPCLFWYNPNIHPFTEYKMRLESFSLFAAGHEKSGSAIDEYGLHFFLNEIYEKNNISRCIKCYKHRIEKTASIAARDGFNFFSTTLLISPYQDHDAIKKIGEEAADIFKVNFFYRDFRPLFRESQSKARTMGFYMQKYCGCILSEEERYVKRLFIKDSKHSSVLERQNDSLLQNNFERLSLITGSEVMEKLSKTNVIIFGVGGVGSWCAEALVRCGVGKISIVDYDTVCRSNINRQLQAATSTLGQSKVLVLKKRLLEINPLCEVSVFNQLFCLESAPLFNIENADYVIDAIDSVKHKIDLIETVCNANVTLFSSMGMALKINPLKIKIASIWETRGCPLARLVRQGLRKRGFCKDFSVVYSDELLTNASKIENNKPVNGSIVTVTAGAGLLLANMVIQNLYSKT